MLLGSCGARCMVPTETPVKLDSNMQGVEFKEPPAVSTDLVCDMSSNFCSKPVDVSKYGVLYAGAQKNIGPAGATIMIVRDDLMGKHRCCLSCQCAERIHHIHVLHASAACSGACKTGPAAAGHVSPAAHTAALRCQSGLTLSSRPHSWVSFVHRKETPSVLEYDTMKDSLFNTPPCYTIYMCALLGCIAIPPSAHAPMSRVHMCAASSPAMQGGRGHSWSCACRCGLVFAHMKAQGGVPAYYKTNQRKAQLLYDTIEGSGGFYASPVNPKDRPAPDLICSWGLFCSSLAWVLASGSSRHPKPDLRLHVAGQVQKPLLGFVC